MLIKPIENQAFQIIANLVHATIDPSLCTSHQTLIETMKGMERVMTNPKAKPGCKTKAFLKKTARGLMVM